MRTVRYYPNRNERIILIMDIDHDLGPVREQAVRTALHDLGADELEFIIVRSLFDVEQNNELIYHWNDLTEFEHEFMQMGEATNIMLFRTDDLHLDLTIIRLYYTLVNL